MCLVDISIILVNFNGADFLCPCLDSVFESIHAYSYEVIVVDNASSDASLDVLRAYGDRIRLIVNAENTGFSFANNQAIRVANARYLFLLNTDTVLAADALALMMLEHEKFPEIGAIAPKLLNADGSLQCPGSSIGHWRFRRDRRGEVPFIAGAAVLMRTSVMHEMGLMDENLFFYNDDIDMSRFLRRKGYPIVYLPTAQVTHYGGLSTVYRKVGSLIEGYRGGIYLAYKHYGTLAGLVYRGVLLVDIFLKLGIYAVRGNWELFGGYMQVLWIDITNDIYLPRMKHVKEI